MKSKKEILRLLTSYKASATKKYGVTRIGIFGSVARGEQTENSDVDVCVGLKEPKLFTLVHIKEELKELFGRPVDVVRLRDVIAHNYLDLDAEVIFEVVKNELPPMLSTLQKMKSDIQQE